MEAVSGDAITYLDKVSDRLQMDVIPVRGKRKESNVFNELGTVAHVNAHLVSAAST